MILPRPIGKSSINCDILYLSRIKILIDVEELKQNQAWIKVNLRKNDVNTLGSISDIVSDLRFLISK